MRVLPFVLLTAKVVPPRLDRLTYPITLNSKDELLELLSGLSREEVCAFDLETKGNMPHLPGTYVVGVALGNESGSIYIDLKSSYDGAWKDICFYLHDNQIPLIAHNVAFDGKWALRDFGLWLPFKYCTYGLYRHLATEGFNGQKWSLKSAQVDLLGWEETNEGELDEWLISNGFANKNGKALKGEMWRAPAEILGKYSALDADSTWQLYHYILRQHLQTFKAYEEFHRVQFLGMVKNVCEGYLRGIQVDGTAMRAYSHTLEGTILGLKHTFYARGDIRRSVDRYHALAREALTAAMPEQRFKKLEVLGQEPERITKGGTISKSWEKWEAKRIRLSQALPEETIHWKNWSAKLERFDWLAENYYTHVIESEFLEEEAHDLGLFNLGSFLQKQWLFYSQEALGNTPTRFTDEFEEKPSVDDSALKLLGEPGRLLIELNEKIKEKSYVDSAINYLVEDDEGEVLHVDLRVPGTLTGRCSGTGGFNIQQQPKTRGYLETWRPRKGYVWIDYDATALEPCVLAELSRDPAMLTLYGPEAKANDIYLFVGARIPGLKEPIIAAGYDPFNPTPEGIKNAKATCKSIRQICKTVVLSSQYGAGPRKIRDSLSLDGIEKSLEEVKFIHQSYWDLFKGIKEYESYLVGQWRKNGGWVLNGLGRPIGVDESYLKDIVNRVVQSTGHGILLYYAKEVNRLLDEAGIEFYPVIADFHDQVIYEVEESRKDEALEIMATHAFTSLNKLLGVGVPGQAIVKIKGSGGFVKNLADAKCE